MMSFMNAREPNQTTRFKCCAGRFVLQVQKILVYNSNNFDLSPLSMCCQGDSRIVSKQTEVFGGDGRQIWR